MAGLFVREFDGTWIRARQPISLMEIVGRLKSRREVTRCPARHTLRLRSGQEARALRGRKQKRRRLQRLRKFQISDLRFEMWETATAKANSRTPRASAAHGAPANAKPGQMQIPHLLKGIRDDRGRSRAIRSHERFRGSDTDPAPTN